MNLLAVRLNAIVFQPYAREVATLEEAGATLVCIDGNDNDSILAAARDCDALLVVSAYLPAAVIGQSTRCRSIARLGAGTDRIDVEAALLDCLQRRAIGGAALDVFSGIDVFALPGTVQPHPLLELDNVIATPPASAVRSSPPRSRQYAARCMQPRCWRVTGRPVKTR